MYYLLGSFIFGMLAPKMDTNLTNAVLNIDLLEKLVSAQLKDDS